jgi:MFS transporter, ACS family, glucarate transporter
MPTESAAAEGEVPLQFPDSAAQRQLQNPQPTGTRWTVFALACAMSFLLYLHRYTWGFVKAEVATEFQWNTDTLGWLDSAFMMSYALGQIPGGMLGDWFGPRKVLGSMVLVWSLAMGGTALVRGLFGMAVTRFLFGAGQAGCYPNLSKVTKSWFPITERTAVQGWVSSFSGRMGGAASFALFGTVLLGWFALPWRIALGWLTVTGIVFTVLFLYLFRSTPREHPWTNGAEAELISAGDPASAVAARTFIDWGLVFRNRSVWALLFQQFTCAFVDSFFSAWVPLYLLQEKSVDIKAAGWMSAVPLIGGACGGMLAGGMLQNWILVRTGNRRWARSGIGLVGNMMAGVCLFDWAQPACWATTTDMGGRNAASLFALVNTSGSIAGFVAGPAMGYTIKLFSKGPQPDTSGWTALFLMIGVIYVASALSWLFIDCRKSVDACETEATPTTSRPG